MKLLEALRNGVKKLESGLADSKLFSHMGDRGEFREGVIREFLRPFLPKCYGLGSGQAFSATGGESKQLDVVIYDDVFSNVLFHDKSNSLFPCESVYGVIEVKSELSSGELSTAIDNVRSLHALDRQPTDMLDLLPHRRFAVGGGLKHSTTQKNRYLGIVFGYDGITATTALENLAIELRDPVQRLALPDFIFNLRRGYMIIRANTTQDQPPAIAAGADFNSYIQIDTQEDTLPLFFLSVNVYLNSVQLRAPDLKSYWNSIIKALGSGGKRSPLIRAEKV